MRYYDDFCCLAALSVFDYLSAVCDCGRNLCGDQFVPYFPECVVYVCELSDDVFYYSVANYYFVFDVAGAAWDGLDGSGIVVCLASPLLAYGYSTFD